MSVDTKFIRRFQDHVVCKLLASSRLQYVSINSERQQVQLAPASRVAPHLAGRNGKVGSGILVRLPSADPADADMPGVQMDCLMWLDIINKDDLALTLSNGSGLTAEEVLAIVWQLLNQWLNQGIGSGNVFVDGFDAIEDQKGAYGYRVQIRLRGAENPPPKCAAPTGSIAAGTLTLSCSTPASTIYYTTDGSLPGNYTPPAGYAANTSQTYLAPVSVLGLASGTVILAAAAAANFDESDVWQFIVP